jgi:hypothetical protein
VNKPVIPLPAWQRLFIFMGVLAVVIVAGAIAGASPEQRRTVSRRMRRRFARFAGA